MCVIIHKSAELAIDSDILADCHEQNFDGFGAIWQDAEGALQCVKGIFGLRRIRRIVRRIKGEAILHFRYATHGGTSPDNCHPFPIAKNAGSLVHNGILDLPTRDGFSDTRELADILQTWTEAEIVAGLPGIADWHGAGNRLALWLPTAGILKTGNWSDFGGHSFSNLNWQGFWSVPTSKPTAYLAGDDCYFSRDYGHVCSYCGAASADLVCDACCNALQPASYRLERRTT